MIHALRAAARAAVSPMIKLGRVVRVHNANEYDVQIPGHVDAYGIECCLQRVRSLTRADLSVGDQVYVCHTNSNRPREGALWVILSQEKQVKKTQPTTREPWWPRLRRTQQRASEGRPNNDTYLPIPLASITPLVVSSDATHIIRADGFFVYQVCLIETEGFWFEVLRAWPLDNPASPYVAAWDHVLASTDTPTYKHAFSNEWLPMLALKASGGPLKVYSPSGHVDSDAAFTCKLEPIISARRKLLAVVDASATEWSWSYISVPGLAVTEGFTTPWNDWSVAQALPHSSPSVSYPIFQCDDMFSHLDVPDLPLVAPITDRSGRLICPPSDDPSWIASAQDDRDNLRERENDEVRNLAHIFSRSHIKVLDDTGAVVWEQDPREHGDYTGFSPLVSVTLPTGRTSLYSHFVNVAFETKQLHHVIYNAGTKYDIDNIDVTDPQAFDNTTWNTAVPAPPYAWRSRYIDSRIPYWLDEWRPSVSLVTRDVESSLSHGIVAHDMTNGDESARWEQTFYSTDIELDEEGHKLDKIDLTTTRDTGDPLCDEHDVATFPYSPRLCVSAALTLKVGTATSDSTSLRSALGLADDEKCILYIAKETYTGEDWTGWSKKFGYFYGNEGFDSRFTPVPVRDPSTGYTFSVGPPYWINERDEFGLVAMYPYGDYSSGNPYVTLGNAAEGYETETVDTFYTAHAVYCLDVDSNGSITFLEPKIGFTDYTDPLGNFSHHTVSVEYHAWVVKTEAITCKGPTPYHAWSTHNVVTDGEWLYLLPRVVKTTEVDEENPPPVQPPQPASLGTAEVLQISTSLTQPKRIKLDELHTLTSHPVGVAMAEQVAGRTVHSHLYVWCAGTDPEAEGRAGKLFHLVDGVVTERLVIEGSENWTSAEILQADSTVESGTDSAIWLSGAGPSGKLVRVGLNNGYFDPTP